MIKRQTIGHARATIMAHDMRPCQAQRIHQPNDIARHFTLGIDGVSRIIGRRLTLAIAAQIGNDHIEMLRQTGRYPMPSHVILRIAMQQDQRRPRAAPMHRERNTIDGHA